MVLDPKGIRRHGKVQDGIRSYPEVLVERPEEVLYVCEGGSGDEANITVQLRTKFPGIGGAIFTYQALPVAYRTDFDYSPQCGHKLFYKHAVIKKLEDYFFMKGSYRYPHVTRPLGSTDDSYIYEWAFGTDGFPWEYVETDGSRIYLDLEEWDCFVGVFGEAGIDLAIDCSDPNDGRISKNLIHQLCYQQSNSLRSLNRIWKRVDFGDRSIRINYEKLEKYIKDNKQELGAHLSAGRLEFLQLACQFLSPQHDIKERDLGKLEQMTLDYRTSTLAHLNTRGVETSPEISLSLPSI
jgi:hypothetical protein